jgi:hypothetical protein
VRGIEVPALESDHVGCSGAGRQAPAKAHDPKLGALEALSNLSRFPGLRNISAEMSLRHDDPNCQTSHCPNEVAIDGRYNYIYIYMYIYIMYVYIYI